MNADLDRLIRLQQLDTTVDEARRKIADYPERTRALGERLAAARDRFAGIKARLGAAQDRRRLEEKEVATVQARLARYKDQLLEVKTNREYTAMLHEIETAQNDVKTREDLILGIMLDADELTAEVKKSEAELKTAEREIAAERAVLETELATLQAAIDRTAASRERLVAEIDRRVLGVFEHVAKNRKGIAVAEAKKGHCTICHVRLRPQVFNEVRRNESIIQCDSCQRILYYAGEADAQAPAPPA